MLDEIEEPLLQELDTVVRATQLSCMPFVRSGRAERLLHTKYPQLAEMIEVEKQELINNVLFEYEANSLSQPGSLLARSKSSTVAGLGLYGQIVKDKGKEGNESVAISTPAREALNAEPMFSMDDISAEPVKDKAPALRQPASDSERPGEGRTIFSLSDIEGSESFKDDHIVPKQSLESKLERSPQTRPIGSPWGSLAIGSKSIGMKDILAEDLSRGVSGIFTGSPSRNSVEKGVQGSFGAKISQKARKKLQAEQLSKFSVENEEKPLSEALSSKNVHENPWLSSNRTKTAAVQINTTPPTARPAKALNTVGRAVSGSQLTMRQTVANNNPASETKSASPGQKPEPLRTVSGPVVSRRDSSNLQMTSATSTPNSSPQTSRSLPRQQVQSIRHTPMPTRIVSDFDANYAISDILSQQQAEKEAIRDAAAKRSLQEIQMEQEFQEWWDQESKKVMEEQQAANARPSGACRHKERRGRGSRRKSDREDVEGERESGDQNKEKGKVGGRRGGREIRDRGGGSSSGTRKRASGNEKDTGTANPPTAAAGRLDGNDKTARRRHHNNKREDKG